jgi:predicted dehydrogenase
MSVAAMTEDSLHTEVRSVTRIGFVGAGNIAGPYAGSVARHPELRLVGVFDLDQPKAAAFAAAHSCEAFDSLSSLARAADIVVNLTSAPYHYATTRELLNLRVPVFSEKPLALSYDEAQELVSLAEQSATPLACAPSLWLGRSYLEAAERIRDGEIGAVRLITAEVHQGRMERWHPAPQSFYQVGPVADVGVYPLTYLTAVLGPIRQVFATSIRALPERTTKDGATFQIGAADAWYVTAVFEAGPALRLSCDYYIGSATVPRSIDFHGDLGSLRVDDWITPDAIIERADVGDAFAAEPVGPKLELDWSLGVLDLARSIRDAIPHRNSAAQAAHVVEVLQAIATSAAEGRAVKVASSFQDPFNASNR